MACANRMAGLGLLIVAATGSAYAYSGGALGALVEGADRTAKGLASTAQFAGDAPRSAVEKFNAAIDELCAPFQGPGDPKAQLAMFRAVWKGGGRQKLLAAAKALHERIDELDGFAGIAMMFPTDRLIYEIETLPGRNWQPAAREAQRSPRSLVAPLAREAQSFVDAVGPALERGEPVSWGDYEPGGVLPIARNARALGLLMEQEQGVILPSLATLSQLVGAIGKPDGRQFEAEVASAVADVESILTETAASQAYLVGIQAEMGNIQTQTTSISNALNAKHSTARSAINNFRE